MIILIAGSPASGKTTIARTLCEYANTTYLNVYHIEVDDIRNICVSDKSFKEFGSDWLDIIENILVLLVQKNKHFIIVEGLFFEQKSIDFISKIVHIDFYFVLKSELSICLKRNKERLQKEEILPDDEIIDLYKLLRKPNFFTTINNNSEINKTITSICKIIGIQ